MSQPKKKTSRSRRDKRRYAAGNDYANLHTELTKCPACNEPVRPHRVCKCGHYKSSAVVQLAGS